MGDAAGGEGHLGDTHRGAAEGEFPIPWDQIDAYVAQKKKQVEDEAAAKARSALPSVKAPHL